MSIGRVILGLSLLVLGAGCSNDDSSSKGGGGGGVATGGAAGSGGAAGGAGGAAGQTGTGGGAGLADACGTGPLAPSSAPLPSKIVAAAPDIEPRVGTDRLEIWLRKSSSLDAGDVTQYQTRACQALRFNLERLELDATESKLGTAVRVVVLDVAAYDAATDAPGTYGVAFGAWGQESDALVVPDGALGSPVDLDDTLAHEINHVVVMRFTPDVELPNWSSEGLAIGVGSHFGMKIHGVPTSFVKGWVAGADGSDAQLTFQRYDINDLTTTLDQVGHDQALSAFFVEYLRVKHPHADEIGFLKEHVWMFTAMRDSNAGPSFAEAFAQTHGGATLDASKAGFVQFLDDTVSDPAARFSGTVFE